LYWLIGAGLIWSLLPLGLVDILIAPKWHAPHWQCDSFGIPFLQTTQALLPWALVAIIVAAILSFPATWNRQGGVDIFNFRFGQSRWKWAINVLILLALGVIAYNLMIKLWQSFIPQTINADCNGRAEPITLAMRRPFVQVTTLCELAIGLWLLHLRSLALSPQTTRGPGRPFPN
jgi:hypothetical protein